MSSETDKQTEDVTNWIKLLVDFEPDSEERRVIMQQILIAQKSNPKLVKKIAMALLMLGKEQEKIYLFMTSSGLLSNEDALKTLAARNSEEANAIVKKYATDKEVEALLPTSSVLGNDELTAWLIEDKKVKRRMADVTVYDALFEHQDQLIGISSSYKPILDKLSYF